MKDKLFKELETKEEENLSGGEMISTVVTDTLTNVGVQNAVAISNSGSTTEGGNSNSGSAIARNTNNP